MEKQAILDALQGGMIVSCQALAHEPLHSSFIMGRMARAAKQAGAVGIRCNSVPDIREIQNETHLPVIAIIKKDYEGSKVYITPTMDEVDALMELKPEVIALDATISLRPGNKTLEQFYHEIRAKYPDQLLMADCSTYEEAIFADQLGFDFIGTTMVGYTDQSKGLRIAENDFELIKRIIANTTHPVIAEGNISTPAKAKRVIEIGSFSVVTGGAITRPQLIAKDFVDAVREGKANWDNRNVPKNYVAIDIGGTAIKYGVVDKDGCVCTANTVETASNGPAILEQVKGIVASFMEQWAPVGIGISTAGMVDCEKGEIIAASGTIPEYVGINYKDTLEEAFGIPCEVENDVNCMALSEYYYGAAKGSKNCFCMTVGTGVGGCVILDGKVYHGSAYGAGEIGYSHTGDGDGVRFEEKASTSAMVKWVAEQKGECVCKWDGKKIVESAKNGDAVCEQGIDRMVDYLARQIANVYFVLDMDRVVVGGGIMEADYVSAKLAEAVQGYLPQTGRNPLTVAVASQGNQAGMMGAYALIRK